MPQTISSRMRESTTSSSGCPCRKAEGAAAGEAEDSRIAVESTVMLMNERMCKMNTMTTELIENRVADMPACFTVKTAWDDEASVWIAICDEIPIATESDTYESLVERVKLVAPEIIELNYGQYAPVDLLFTEGVLTEDGLL